MLANSSTLFGILRASVMLAAGEMPAGDKASDMR